MSDVVSGGCQCGAVRYKTATAPMTSRLCWCRVCQYIAAGNATVNVCFPAAGFEVSGEPQDFVSIAESGSRMHRRFCGVCGTPLFSQAEARPHLVFVRAGTLDDPNIAKPESTIWARSAPDWACIDERLPRIDGQPPPVTG
jgi:hypothetical protein